MPNVTRSALSRTLAETDPEIASAVANELKRQSEGLELIASENFVSQAILETAGSVLTNKYAEGYPGRRYYGGCEFVDVAESLAIARAKALFGADHANVQPHSGAQANMAVYLTLLQPGDTVLGMNLSHGGHLTHGHPLNFSGKLYTIVPYGVRKDDERIDYDELDRLADEHKPKMIIVGASAYPRVIDFSRFRRTADRVGAVVFTDMAHIAGLVAAGVHPSPVPHSDFVTTTTHKTLRGTALEGGQRLGERSRVCEDLGDAVAQTPYSGNIRHSFSTSSLTMASAASSLGVASARMMSSPILSISRSPIPRVVTAGVPMRMPLAVIGGFGSNGMAFLLTVMPALSRAASATLPVIPFEKTSTSIRWLSVPPLTRRNPAATSAAASREAFATICR